MRVLSVLSVVSPVPKVTSGLISLSLSHCGVAISRRATPLTELTKLQRCLAGQECSACADAAVGTWKRGAKDV
jgi:hypothetical protein